MGAFCQRYVHKKIIQLINVAFFFFDKYYLIDMYSSQCKLKKKKKTKHTCAKKKACLFDRLIDERRPLLNLSLNNISQSFQETCSNFLIFENQIFKLKQKRT